MKWTTKSKCSFLREHRCKKMVINLLSITSNNESYYLLIEDGK